MALPNAERAIADLEKLRDYCLNPDHPRGRHKARVFEAVLGFTSAHALELRAMLLIGARSGDAVPAEHDQYGQRYVVDFAASGRNRAVIIRSAWIVRSGEDFPRLTSCFIL
ncbi:MAG TPA: hypothetical protein VFZ25_10715 [Chloroflexota bacterium]|nr:hypothetical protein [Chloroflexota bacterium]